ncbi:diadenosine tetraphosphate (Ap4A) hydrolase [Longilinea arvoryzae]|uniref:Diadenosine tetraphosphate (Ap4A) hydrolase n=2 Tax=Longilinea arvoryzae TaxID=360412 RepID=A0A0K8MZ68_9CHLR|nr:diadenosine tetraphosphate (Ap4A) hydrolase [Longilinea arvoryzae]
MTLIHRNVEACRAGTFPPLICRLPSGWAVLCDMQYLRGYTILLADPVVSSLNALDRAARAAYLLDTAVIGDALIEVTGAYRINYATMGNSEPALHTHIIPRYRTEPDAYRKIGPWSYPDEILNGTPFDPIRDADLIARLAGAIQKRL